jgi:hypothetical protein
MPPTLALLVAVSAFLVAGCGAGQESSADRFRGAEAEIAEVVDELQSAGRSKDAAKICGEIFSASLAERFRAGGRDCVDEVGEAVDDADDYDLDVRDVTVTGNTATAVVRQGDDPPVTATFEFERLRGDWRATSLSGQG